MLVVLVAALSLSPLAAEAQTGEIVGQVRDTSGGALSGVTITVSSAALIEGTRTTTTDDRGRFRVPAVAVGTYEVRFMQPGFTAVTRTNVDVSSGFTAT